MAPISLGYLYNGVCIAALNYYIFAIHIYYEKRLI